MSSLKARDGIDAARSVIAAAGSTGAVARALGGIAVAMRCPSARDSGPFARSYSDIDLVTTRDSSPVLGDTLEAMGYVAEERFNALHGRSRMMFNRAGGFHVDVFVDEFAMCHRLDLADRLDLDKATLSLGDLLLTKLQVAELNKKDVTDLAALLLDHELSSDECGINISYINSVLCNDWGWWRTATYNLNALAVHLEGLLESAASARVVARITRLTECIDQEPKRLRWRMRAKLGDKMAWREEPEETR